VADANVFVAAFLRDATSRRIVLLSGLRLFVPEYLFEEVQAHLPALRRKARLRAQEAREMVERLMPYFVVVPKEIVASRLAEAEGIMKEIDPRDAPYLATALAVPCDGVWSDDAHFKRQERVPCWTTAELVAALREAGLRL
jgi:predicted nucleic acid-binding protein